MIAGGGVVNNDGLGVLDHSLHVLWNGVPTHKVETGFLGSHDAVIDMKRAMGVRTVLGFMRKLLVQKTAATSTDLKTATGRASAMRWFYWRDHHVLRLKWHNFAQVAPGVYRSNQPDMKRLKTYQKLGVKSVLNLRGESKKPFFALTQEACDAAGMNLHTINNLSASKAPDQAALLEIFGIFDRAERGLLIHCRSGADRTGLISTFYLVDKCGMPLAQARKHLSLRYLHIRWSASGILDMMLDDFAAVEGSKSLREWIAEDYDATDLTARFKG